jgi:hypothetical protein
MQVGVPLKDGGPIRSDLINFFELALGLTEG